MARIRVFLTTYRRPRLLRRALASLLAQSFTDWICELHNDAPEDDSPRQILAELAPGDPRIEYHHHSSNWGAVKVFNHVFAGGPEAFAALLEDDNWWEPLFLETLVGIIATRPEAAIVWANMRLWQENPDGRWTDTGRTVWSLSSPDRPVTFESPEILQAFDALHSNGAMVFRPEKFLSRGVPPAIPFALIEPLRERAADGTLLFVPHVLAHFACTLRSTRRADAGEWLQAKLLLAVSFFSQVQVNDDVLRGIWKSRRELRPPDTDLFFFLALILREKRLVRPARAFDWLHFLLATLRHPRRFAQGLRFRRDHPETWAWLRAQSPATPVPARATLFSKQT